MAKKSSTNRSRPAPQAAKGAARKPQQTPDRASTATLVRPAGATGVVEVTEAPAPTPSAANIVAEPAPQAKPAAQPKPAAVKPTPTAARPAEQKPAAPKSAPVASKMVAPAAKPAAKPAAQPAAKPAPARPASASTREQNIRMARARATARARQANLISAEHYAYVLGDLKLVVALAASAFVILIALAFILPH